VEPGLERLVRAYLADRNINESFKVFCDRHTDAELIAIAAVTGPADQSHEHGGQ
jgi:hypothetical protein